ncbi:tubulin-like doman-containing protein [Sulfuriroseicoccus oceanibius]|uniref:Tubulin like n=1 Tax=Sulfuriroseicoccus oceanibius TaxID=2707525 RepID=A0A6B3L6S0_9BACT|nr:tubulin-like doman-containing protein [Sulfuriroseicoccus oceanibius]QQL43761.1 hypothetical protein G3M56_007560 [Sulfuriroseicoccus oceanibius]
MKNHLFIGLGGQGGNSLAEMRKVMHQRADDIRLLKREKGTQFDFLYIDSSTNVLNYTKKWTSFGEDLSLPPKCFLNLKEMGATIDIDQLAMKPDIAPWIGDVEQIKGFLDASDTIEGANQRRRFGRILFANSIDSVKNAIDGKVRTMTAAAKQCAFHVFASLAGGTGSGSIVDLVTLLRTMHPYSSMQGGFPIFVYLYVTSDNYQDAEVGNFHQNQYATLRDLNALACGRIAPTLLGDQFGGSSFACSEPINQIILSSSHNNGDQNVELEKQHRIIAESAFERIFAFCSGQLPPQQQDQLTGQDKIPNFPGEPINKPIRSFRFGSSGMQRWEVPTEKITELLALELYSSSYNQMLYNNWHGNDGFIGKKSTESDKVVESTFNTLRTKLDEHLVESTHHTNLRASFETDAKAVLDREISTKFQETDLEKLEESLHTRFEKHLNGQGINAVIADFKASREGRIQQFTKELHRILREEWSKAVDPIGMANVSDILKRLQNDVNRKIKDGNSSSKSGSDTTERRLSDRRIEWSKMTFLSRRFKKEPLARKQHSDCKSLLLGKLATAIAEEDLAYHNAIANSLTGIEHQYKNAARKLQGFADWASNRRDVLLGELKDLNKSHTSNKYEIDYDGLLQYISVQRSSESHCRAIADQLRRDVVLELLGKNVPLTEIESFEGDRLTNYQIEADRLVFAHVQSIHKDFEEQRLAPAVLTSSLMDALQAKFEKDPGAFKNELKEFIDQTTCLIKIHNDQQPKMIAGNMTMPTMPTTSRVLALPKGHAFAAKFEEIAAELRPANEANNPVRVVSHDDSTQIRLLMTVTWMAARFAKVTHELADKYAKAIEQNTLGDIAYFSNIDAKGEHDELPDLLQPSASEQRDIMRASLWLGQRTLADGSGTTVITVTEDAVQLVTLDRNGDTNFYELGESIEHLETKADIRLIARVNEAVTGEIAGATTATKDELANAMKAEESKLINEFGTGSKQHVQWTKTRTHIRKILSV